MILTLGCRVTSRGRIRHRFTKERLNVGSIKIIHNYCVDYNMKYRSNITTAIEAIPNAIPINDRIRVIVQAHPFPFINPKP
jgi:hypothetical protein